MMIRMMTTVLAVLTTLTTLFGQSLWVETTRAQILQSPQEAYVLPQEGHFYALNFDQLVQALQHKQSTTLTLPDANGVLAEYQVTFSPVAEPGYYALHPQTGTYQVTSLRDPAIYGRIDHTVNGFHAIITDHGKVWMIDPVFQDNTSIYAVYFQNRYHQKGTKPAFECETGMGMMPDPSEAIAAQPVTSLRNATIDRKHFRLALATTGEYASFHGGTIPKVSAALITAVNRVNQIYEVDLGVRLVLIANNDDLIFLNPNTDGYTNGNPQAMIQENPNVISGVMPASSYDIGHVFGTALASGTIGLASLGSVCTGNKARAMSSYFTPVFDAFYVDVVAHEVGHQFSAQHSFNKCDEMNENPSTGWEPGSGSTIMSYAGSCNINNVEDESEPYFHGGSLEQMKTFLAIGAGSGCGSFVSTSNDAPSVETIYKNGFYIPISTPFKLHAEGSDPNNNALTYCWEEMDTGPITDAGNPLLNSPLFRSFLPTSDSMHWFPQQFRIIQNVPSKYELLPTYSRDMTFRVTVRDNHPEAGAIAQKDVAFKATSMAGPFTVSNFNTVDTVRHGEYVEVTWNVNKTDVWPVNCQTVNIKLSTDGGFNYPYVLAENVPNNGSFFVTIPIVTTTAGRIMVEAADNVFYDINNANLRVLPPTSPGFAINLTPYTQVGCIPSSSIIKLETSSLLGFTNPVTFTLTSGLPPGAIASWSTNPAIPPQDVFLELDLTGVTQTGLYELQITAEANGAETASRNAFVDVYKSDFSSLDALTPASGAGGVGVSPLLTWVDQEDAQTYTVEVATSPAFGNTVVISQAGLTDPQYQIVQMLEENTLYFWRVIPENVCGTLDNAPVYAFHTLTISCDELSNNTEFNIPGTTPATVESVITVPVNGPVGLVRVKNITGNHQNIGNLRGNLKGPDGKSKRLWNPQCSFIAGDIKMSFNDDSQTPFSCPPSIGETYKSVEPLADFTGDDIQGDWTLIVQDIQAGSGGKLTSWTLEFCTSVALNAPYQVNNDTLKIKPGTFNVIDNDHLLSQDADNGPDQLTYTVVTLPTKGTLRNGFISLEIGDRFTQDDLDKVLISYEHIGIAEENDHFTFTVEDDNGGWFGINQFNIQTSNSVATTNPDAASLNMQIWPNPARDYCTILIPGQDLNVRQVTVVNTLGQVVPVSLQQLAADRLSLQTNGLAHGLYYIQVTIGDRLAVSKLQVAGQ
ncbi:MAG: proprotein convertase P-domain-containing protein [Saprospiraceae bacterium]|nr:proprotein convertase P-domain-containing protein [Saprospiraceae bacterium]